VLRFNREQASMGIRAHPKVEYAKIHCTWLEMGRPTGSQGGCDYEENQPREMR